MFALLLTAVLDTDSLVDGVGVGSAVSAQGSVQVIPADTHPTLHVNIIHSHTQSLLTCCKIIISCNWNKRAYRGQRPSALLNQEYMILRVLFCLNHNE